MIDNYLNYLQEEKQELIESPTIVAIMIAKIIKKYIGYKKIMSNCTTLNGKERKKCYYRYRIISLQKAKIKILSFKSTCDKWSKDVTSCYQNIIKQINKIDDEIKKLKRKLSKI